MPKRKAEFSEHSVVVSLINEVKKRSCLWNNQDKGYNDRQQMSAAWEEISSILDIGVDTMRLKWKGLRDFFKRIVRKRGINDVDEYSGGWRYFRLMWFLKKSELTHNDDDSSDEATNTSNELTKCEPLEFSETEMFREEPDPIPNKRRATTADEDFDQMFLRSLTPYLRQLEPIRKLVVRNKIQEILLNELAAQKTSNNKF